MEKVDDTKDFDDRTKKWPLITRDIRSSSFDQLDQYLKSIIREIKDFPKTGMNYYDVTTLLLDPSAFQATINAFTRRYEDMNISHIVSCESRGFIFGSPLALSLKCPFVPIRRARRLPGPTIGIDYKNGFSTDRLEIHQGAISPGSRVVIIDDMVSTGKTLQVASKLIHQLQANVVECGCVIDIKEFRNEDLIHDLPLFALLSF